MVVHKRFGEAYCYICHSEKGALKPNTSDICIRCHEKTVTILGGNTLNTHVLPMNRHAIKQPLFFDKFRTIIKQDEAGVYVQNKGDRLPLFGDNRETATLECPTCHDPHGESGVSKMLRVDNSCERLCNVCHNAVPIKTAIGRSLDGIKFKNVHDISESKCGYCHSSDEPEIGSIKFREDDLSCLCTSCHRDEVTIHPGNILESRVQVMNNHPIKFSPLSFDKESVNNNIIIDEGMYYISAERGRLPLFGKDMGSAVAECVTCHDPHGGESGLAFLKRVDDSEGQLCLICHIDTKYIKEPK
ncbi:MAG: hypothetical protein HY809_05185 [Nitrospirae bacterium]|nr:hypothetical protein [Nitrospirota bacterium]